MKTQSLAVAAKLTVPYEKPAEKPDEGNFMRDFAQYCKTLAKPKKVWGGNKPLVSAETQKKKRVKLDRRKDTR